MPGQTEGAERAIGAFVAAALGDALGWPQEAQARRVGLDRRVGKAEYGLRQWSRRAGGRFYSHQEVIRAGEYSDDTQLLLCTSRSLLRGPNWFRHFSTTELPAWLVYERGGGGATKRAARAWLLNKPPWSTDLSETDRAAYFAAGGNGVAMRVMPHSMIGAVLDDFFPTARDVVANGICTHGHPRALIGALAYGYALWVAFRQAGTLEYGHIVDATADAFQVWSQLPLTDLPGDWLVGLKKESKERYGMTWRNAIAEMNDLLGLCRRAMQQGALSVDRSLLETLGCFSKDIGGAGTITAAAAIFLASRYAADPMHGVLQAAFALGADTDTLASMTGALLGAALGDAWLPDYARDVQDVQYLTAMAKKLSSRETVVDEPKPEASPSIRERFIAELQDWRPDRTLMLPDGRVVEHVERVSPAPSGRGARVDVWRVRTVDGQVVYVKRLGRQRHEVTVTRAQGGRLTAPIYARKPRIKLFVRSLERSRGFYSDLIGLPVVQQTSASVNLADVIVLVPMRGGAEAATDMGEGSSTLNAATIVVEAKSVSDLYQRVKQSGTRILTPLRQLGGRQFFRCLDVDRNVVEVVDQDSESLAHAMTETDDTKEIVANETSFGLFREDGPPDV